jgi:hypothetical protein
MLLQVNAYWFPEDYDEDEYKSLGKKPKMTLEEMIINTAHVVAFHPHTSGLTMIRLLSGDVFKIEHKYEDFKDLMFGEEVSRDFMVSKEN